MKKTLLAVTTALLLTGAAVSTASAQDRYYYPDEARYVEDDRDRGDVQNGYDRYDDRRDDDGRYDDRRYDDRRQDRRFARDRDCDGVADRYDYNDRRNVRDRDCDGVPNRYDRHNDRVSTARHRYSAPRYMAPRNYRASRWNVGTYLPQGYYGNSYYVDYRSYGLASPPYGYRWNRVGSDVYLVSTRNGLIAEVIYSLFR